LRYFRLRIEQEIRRTHQGEEETLHGRENEEEREREREREREIERERERERERRQKKERLLDIH